LTAKRKFELRIIESIFDLSLRRPLNSQDHLRKYSNRVVRLPRLPIIKA
jgi:hypothetical protein